MDRFIELIDVDATNESLRYKLEKGKKLLLENENITLYNTNIIDTINNVLVMATKVKKELVKTQKLKRGNFVAINKMQWSCIDTLTSILEKIEKDKEN